MTKKLLETIGVNPKRLRLEWISAAEGQKFASLIHEFTKEIRASGQFASKAKEIEIPVQ